MRYFFHFRRGDGRVVDDEGTELPDLDAVRAEAFKAAREMMCHAIMDGRDVSGRTFEIADEEAKVILLVPFADAIRQAA